MRLHTLISGLICAAVVTTSQAADDKAAEAWNTKLVIGANVAKGNSENIAVNAGIAADKKKDSNEMHLGVEGHYGETEVFMADGSRTTDTSVQNAQALATYRRLLDERTYLSPHVDLSHDEIADVKYRLITGAAVGHYFIKEETSNLSAEIGADYIRDEVGDVTDDRTALRVAQRGDHKLTTGAKIWESVEYLPTFDDFGRFLLNAEIGTETAVTRSMNLRLVVQDRYNSKPPEGAKCNDLVVTAGLSWTL